MSARTATFVTRKDGTGDGRVYRCEPPMPIHEWLAEDHDVDECPGTGACTSTEYVWVSAAQVMLSGPETYIFPCDADGEVTDWGELPGSLRGVLDHKEALAEAGYEVIA